LRDAKKKSAKLRERHRVMHLEMQHETNLTKQSGASDVMALVVTRVLGVSVMISQGGTVLVRMVLAMNLLGHDESH